MIRAQDFVNADLDIINALPAHIRDEVKRLRREQPRETVDEQYTSSSKWTWDHEVTAEELIDVNTRLFADVVRAENWRPYTRHADVRYVNGERQERWGRTRPVSEARVEALETPSYHEDRLHAYLSDDNAVRGEQMRTRGTMRMMEARKALQGVSQVAVDEGLDLVKGSRKDVIAEVKADHEGDMSEEAWDEVRDRLVALVKGQCRLRQHHAEAVVKLSYAIRDMSKGNRLLDYAVQRPR